MGVSGVPDISEPGPAGYPGYLRDIREYQESGSGTGVSGSLPDLPDSTQDEAAQLPTEMARQVHLSGRQSTVVSALCVAEDHDADRDDGEQGSEKLSLLRPNTRKLSVHEKQHRVAKPEPPRCNSSPR